MDIKEGVSLLTVFRGTSLGKSRTPSAYKKDAHTPYGV